MDGLKRDDDLGLKHPHHVMYVPLMHELVLVHNKYEREHAGSTIGPSRLPKTYLLCWDLFICTSSSGFRFVAITSHTTVKT